MSSSESSSSAATNQTDNRRVIGERGISAENSTVNVTTLDAQVANRAISATSDVSIKALDASLDFSDAAQGKAYKFAAESQHTALDSLLTTSGLVKDAYADAKGRGALTDKILIGTVVMIGLVALAAVKK